MQTTPAEAVTGNGAQAILLVGYEGRFPNVLKALLRDTFEPVRIDETDDIKSFLARAPGPVFALVLVNESCCNDVLLYAAAAKARFHKALVALTFDGPLVAPDCIELCLRSAFINSFLPMDMNVEVWLAAVAMMLKGGRYVPAAMLDDFFERGHRAGRASGGENGANRPFLPQATNGATDRDRDEAIDSLTPREVEVLELASTGLQNKNIACVLGLSEHTVKLHMHHVISKLSVHNRTEAAACFLVHMATTRVATHAPEQ